MDLELVIAVGLPGSGKDFVYHNVFEPEGFVHVSSDLIREEIFGDVNDQTHNTEVFEEMFRRTVEALKAGKSVFYNATNVSAKRRIFFIDRVKRAAGRINFEINCVFVATPYIRVCKQNEARERTVPEEVLMRMLKQFDVPSIKEGFDHIMTCGADELIEISTLMDLLDEIPHDNPHHSLTIGEHMRLAEKYYQSRTGEDYSYLGRIAAYCHDIGKYLTKTFSNAKGEPTETAHYYGHENAGAYLFFSECYFADIELDIEDKLYIARLIQHHMDHFKGEKYCRKVRNRYGEDFFKQIEAIHAADVAAH